MNPALAADAGAGAGSAISEAPGAAGTVAALYIAAAGGQPMRACGAVVAVRGKGLVGDRYCGGVGRFSGGQSRGREVTDLTLVEIEVVELLRDEYGIDVDPAATRRNVVTRGARLNHLTGKTFTVGEVRLQGVNLCEPCASLFGADQDRGALRALVHKGGLRARILSGGVMRAGDPIVQQPKSPRPKRPSCRLS